MTVKKIVTHCHGCGMSLSKIEPSSYDPLFCIGCVPKLNDWQIALVHIYRGHLLEYDVQTYAGHVLNGGDPKMLDLSKPKE